MLAQLVLAFRLWRHKRLQARATRKRKRANVLDAKAAALANIIRDELKDEGWNP